MFHVKQTKQSLLRVATYNIHAGKDAKGRASLPEIAAVLQGCNADIVFLQECDRFLPRSGFCDQAAFLARTLGFHRTFFGPLGMGAARFGNAVLTRAAPDAVSHVRLPASGGEPRGAVGAHVAGVWAWGVHLGLRDDWRRTQLSHLAKSVNEPQPTRETKRRSRTAPTPQAIIPTLQNYNNAPKTATIVGGDFNCFPDAPELQRFITDAQLRVVSPDAPTFPGENPTARIDFLLARGFAPVRETNSDTPHGGVTLSPASDHCLVWQDLEATGED